MSTNVKWQDLNSDSPVTDFAIKNNLSVDSLTKTNRVLILPSSSNFTRLPEQHLFSAYAKEVLFVLKESGVDASFYEDERLRRELVLKDATTGRSLALFEDIRLQIAGMLAPSVVPFSAPYPQSRQRVAGIGDMVLPNPPTQKRWSQAINHRRPQHVERNSWCWASGPTVRANSRQT